jgi:HipA-like protein
VTDELVALLDGREAGRIHNDRGRLTFVYDDDWRNAADAYPLSLPMPLAAKEHGRAVIDAYLWGLLPDNERVLDRWAARFHVSARNAFALISPVGEDCAGAIQFVTPDRLATIRSGKEDNVEWLDEADIAKRLQALPRTMPRGGFHTIPVSSALPALNPKRPCFCRTAAGVFRPADCRRPTFSSPRPAISTGRRKTSTSV